MGLAPHPVPTEGIADFMITQIADLTTYLIDLDGVIYRGEALLSGAQEFVRWLNEYEKKYLFAICGHTGPFRASLRATGYQKSLRAFFHRGKIGGQILRLARSRREHVQTHMSVKI